MKKLMLTLLIAASSSSAFAFHPKDTDDVADIGIGSKMIVTADYNIKPNSYYINGLQHNCFIQMWNSQVYDQVLKAGTVFTIISTEKNNQEAYGQTLRVDNPKVQGITCRRWASIGELKQDFRKNFIIKLATPKEF